MPSVICGRELPNPYIIGISEGIGSLQSLHSTGSTFHGYFYTNLDHIWALYIELLCNHFDIAIEYIDPIIRIIPFLINMVSDEVHLCSLVSTP